MRKGLKFTLLYMLSSGNELYTSGTIQLQLSVHSIVVEEHYCHMAACNRVESDLCI